MGEGLPYTSLAKGMFMKISLAILSYTIGLMILTQAVPLLFRKEFRNRAHIFLSITALFTAIWAFSYAIMYATEDGELASWSYRLGSLGWTVGFSTVTIFFNMLFNTISGKKTNPWGGAFLMAAGCVFFYAAASGNIVAHDFKPAPWGWKEIVDTGSPWVIAYGVFILSLMSTVIVRTVISWKRSHLNKHRMQIRMIGIPFAAITIPVACLNYLAPLLGFTEIPPLGHLGICCIIFLICKSAIRYRMLTIDPVYAAEALLFDVSDYVFLTDTAGRIRKAGFAAIKILGVDAQAISTKNISDIAPQLTHAKMIDLVAKDSPAFQTEIHLPDGSSIPADCKVTAVMDTHNDLMGYLLVMKDLRDMAESKRALASLRESEEKYRTLIEQMEDGYFEVDLAGNFTFVNDAEVRSIGSSRDELMGVNNRRYQDEANAKKTYQHYKKLYKTGEPIKAMEYEIIRKNGTKGFHEVSALLIKDTEGRPVGFRGISRDVTERRQAEEELKRSREMLSLITENMSDMIRVADLQGNNLYVSPSHYKGLGYSQEERIGKAGLDIVHPDDIEMIINKFSEGRASRQPVRVEYRVRHADGHYVWLDTVADLLRDAQGEPTAIVMSSRDISDRKRLEEDHQKLEERLNRAEKMEALGQLAGGVAHDLNNVLGALTGYSELLLMQIPEGQKARTYVEKILLSTEKGAAIIQDLLTLARRGLTASDVINLNNVITGFLKTPVFEKLKDYHPQITFKTDLQEALLNIKGSSVHLEKTLMNLVSNAAESISGQGEITIRTENRYLDKAVLGYDEVKEGDYAILTVSDTGMGIPEENKDKIFEPFYTKKTLGRSGTGLGLSIVWGTVKDNNGYIDVQTKVGEGTTFTLYFPITRDELLLPQQKVSKEQYMGNGESVLVVDDVAEQREIASGLLKQLNYNVHAVSSGEEAVEYLKSNKADILVLDMIMLPGMDGLDTYQKILEIHPKQKAILVSGFSETSRLREAQKLGAGAYVKKPYVMEKIGMAVRDELKK